MTQAYPLKWPDGWPRTTVRKSHSLFRTTFMKARTELYQELERLRAKHVVVSSWMPLRLDGLPRADAARMKIDDPGVAVYFDLRGRPMVMARDAFWTVHDNLRSIGLAIEHLRGLERHGGATMMERAFDGFAALPPPKAAGTAGKAWWEILGVSERATREEIDEAFRKRAKEAHPDVGGTTEMMAAVLEARNKGYRIVGAAP